MVCRSYSLPVKDRAGRAWEFVIKSWANGTEHRRVYVLEQVSGYIKVNRLREGDAIGICADEDGVVTIEVCLQLILTLICRQKSTSLTLGSLGWVEPADYTCTWHTKSAAYSGLILGNIAPHMPIWELKSAVIPGQHGGGASDSAAAGVRGAARAAAAAAAGPVQGGAAHLRHTRPLHAQPLLHQALRSPRVLFRSSRPRHRPRRPPAPRRTRPGRQPRLRRRALQQRRHRLRPALPIQWPTQVRTSGGSGIRLAQAYNGQSANYCSHKVNTRRTDVGSLLHQMSPSTLSQNLLVPAGICHRCPPLATSIMAVRIRNGQGF